MLTDALTSDTGRMKSTIPRVPNAWDIEDQTALGKGSSQVANMILLTTHSLALLPLFLTVVLQDVHLKLVTVLNTTIMILVTMGNFVFYCMHIVKVYPKLLDTFLLLFYASMIPLVYIEYVWLQYWICVYHHTVVAGFMWLSVKLPFWDDFGLESLKDYLPEQLWRSQETRCTALRVSQIWATAMTFMALAALAPTLSGHNNVLAPMHIIFNYVLGAIALLVASAAHHWLFSRSVKAASEQPVYGDAQAGRVVSMPFADPQASCFEFTAASLFSQTQHTHGDQNSSMRSNSSSSEIGSDVGQARPDTAHSVAAHVG